MKLGFKLSILFVAFLLTGCIKDDFLDDAVEERISINNPISEIQTNDTYSLMATYFNTIGEAENAPIVWSTSNPAISTITNEGMLTGISEGSSIISAMVTLSDGSIISDEFSISVVDEEVITPEPVTKSGTISTTSSYLLTGDFTLSEIQGSNNLDLQIMSNYQASTSLPGLYIYLSNNPNSVGSALQIGPVTVFNGAHNYQIDNTGINDYQYIVYWCEPFGVKVGHGEIIE